MSDQVIHVSDAEFEQQVLKSEQPVLVDFWAEWCGPCKMIAPIIEDIAPNFSDKVKFVKLNIDENPGTPPRFGIRSIPTLMLFKGGNVEATQVGAVSRSQLENFINSNI